MATPLPHKYYQHRYGGVYQVDVSCSLSTVDKSEWIVYTHVRPFPPQTWHRPKTEWEEEGRFRELTGEELRELFDRDPIEFQNEITANKEASKKDK